tara:strand:- start:5526 stop:6296 length:771 start_codon:yes stop_codon:yes gene_type:complete
MSGKKYFHHQNWIAERYSLNAGFVPELGQPVVDLLKPQTGELILDLGCGEGTLTEKLLEFATSVIGVDNSLNQIEAAKKKGLLVCIADGHSLPFQENFDGIFSNAALHWMSSDPNAVLLEVWRALKKGGRFAAEMGGQGNVASITNALSNALKRRNIDPDSVFPWYFPSSQTYSAQLKKAGFLISYIELFNRPTELPGDISGWLETFGESFLFTVPSEERAYIVTEVAEELRPHLFKKGKWIVDYVRLRFLAEKPA